jgi:hypothetical protein
MIATTAYVFFFLFGIILNHLELEIKAYCIDRAEHEFHIEIFGTRCLIDWPAFLPEFSLIIIFAAFFWMVINIPFFLVLSYLNKHQKATKNSN